jgi:two-component system, LuxR family, response regulator FixJ
MCGEGKLIAIVDDDGAVRDALSRLLDSAGLAAESYASAEDFLAASAPARTACLILDVRMPGMDGFALQRKLAEIGWMRPIIFISADADEDTRARALRAGAAAFFIKPFANDPFVEAVESAVARAA